MNRIPASTGLLIPAILLIGAPLFIASPSSDGADEVAPRIDVKMKGFENSDGQALVYLYRSKEGFPTQPAKAWKRTKADISKKRARASFSGIPHGTYAVSVIHDENGDGKLETGFLGIPREGVGVSKNASGMPTFKKAKFVLEEDELTLVIRIRYL